MCDCESVLNTELIKLYDAYDSALHRLFTNPEEESSIHISLGILCDRIQFLEGLIDKIAPGARQGTKNRR